MLNKLFTKKNDTLKYEFLPAALEITETPPNKFGYIVLWMLIALIFIALAWAYFGRIDVIATATGKVIPDGNVKVVQSSAGGVVTTIKVNDGDTVKKGDLLVSLDATTSEGDVTTIEKSLAIARLERDVMRAVASGNDVNQVIDASDAPDDAKNDLRSLAQSEVSAYQVQRQFATVAVSQASTQLASENKNLASAKAALISAQQTQQPLQAQYDAASGTDKTTLQTQLSYANSLVRSASDTVDTMQDRVTSAQSTLNSAQSSLAQLDGANSSNSLSTVVDQDKTIADLEGQLEKAKKTVADQSMYSPVDGTVMSLAVNTLGGVVSAGQQIAIVVPTNTPLLIEASLANADVGYVHVGQRVAIKVDTFSFQRYGILEGEVKSISPDAVQNEQTGALTYTLKVHIKSTTSSKDQTIALQSGMSVTSEIKTDDRRIISFFLDPLIKGLDTSLKSR
jgi:hemolysin D